MTMLIIFFGVTVVLSAYFSFFVEPKEEKIRINKAKEELRLELERPRYRVAFEVRGLSRYTFAPEPKLLWSWNSSYLQSSKERAEFLKRQCFERGYFEEEDGTSYPACNVTNVRIEEQK